MISNHAASAAIGYASVVLQKELGHARPFNIHLAVKKGKVEQDSAKRADWKAMLAEQEIS
jgi:hypothetical protein